MEEFDPYRIWLGIPPQEQPPNHYRLLGLGLFESDTDAISNAADRQMVHVRTFQTGEYFEFSQQILNELAAARLCLLDARKKDEYDYNLRRELAGEKPMPSPPAVVPPPQPSPEHSIPPPQPPPSNSIPPPQPPTSHSIPAPQPPAGNTEPPPQPPAGSLSPPVSPPPAVPPVANGRRGLCGVTRPRRYPTRRKNSSWWVSLIALAIVFVSLALLAWTLSHRNLQQPRKPAASAGRHGNIASSRGQSSTRRPRRPNNRRAR